MQEAQQRKRPRLLFIECSEPREGRRMESEGHSALESLKAGLADSLLNSYRRAQE